MNIYLIGVINKFPLKLTNNIDYSFFSFYYNKNNYN